METLNARCRRFNRPRPPLTRESYVARTSLGNNSRDKRKLAIELRACKWTLAVDGGSLIGNQ